MLGPNSLQHKIYILFNILLSFYEEVMMHTYMRFRADNYPCTLKTRDWRQWEIKNIAVWKRFTFLIYEMDDSGCTFLNNVLEKINGAHWDNAVLDISCIPVSFVNPDKTYLSLFLCLMKFCTDRIYEDSGWGISSVRNWWVVLCICLHILSWNPLWKLYQQSHLFFLCLITLVLGVWTCILFHSRQQQLQSTTFYNWYTSGVQLILCTWLSCSQLWISGDAPGVHTSSCSAAFVPLLQDLALGEHPILSYQQKYKGNAWGWLWHLIQQL